VSGERTGQQETEHDDGALLERAARHCARFFPDGGPLGALTAQQIIDRFAELAAHAATDEAWRGTPTPLPAGLPLINSRGEIEVTAVVTGDQFAAAAAFAAAECELAARRFRVASTNLVALARSARVLAETAAVFASGEAGS